MAGGSKRCVEYEVTDSLCRLGEVLLAFASGVLTMVTFGTPFWMVKEPSTSSLDGTAYHLGLWQNCTVMDACRGLPLKAAHVPSEYKEIVLVCRRRHVSLCKIFTHNHSRPQCICS